LRLPRLPIPPEARKMKNPSISRGVSVIPWIQPKSAAPLCTQQIAEAFGQIRLE
jgi:hypothetical protein